MLKLLLFVAVVAAVVYLTVRQLERRGTITAPRPRPRAERRPMGPDDDLDFLRDLDRRTRHRKRQPKPDSGPKPESGPDPEPGPTPEPGDPDSPT